MSRFAWVLVVALGAPAVGDEPAETPDAQPPVIRRPVASYESPVCFGRGYVPYAYPAAGTCPCTHNRCYDPAKYFCGGRTYRKQWLRRWAGAHCRKTSMLGGVPCECRLPSIGRTGRGIRVDVAPTLEEERPGSTSPDEESQPVPPGIEPGG